MTVGRGTLAMQRLGVRLIEQRNPDDAIVLGDAMQAAGIDGLITGRSRPVYFRTATTAHGDTFMRITTRDEQRIIEHTRWTSPTFAVQGYETINNVGRFAAAPGDERWNDIWTVWVTPLRSTYRALVEAQLLPRTILFREIRWDGPYGTGAPDGYGSGLAYRLYLDRVLPHWKEPIAAYLFDVMWRDDDNPHTLEQHFDEPSR